MLPMEIDKAGAGGHPATTRLNATYLFHHSPSRPRSRKSATAIDALGSLVLYLLGRDLPRREFRFGWQLAEAWLGKLVETKAHSTAGVA